MTTYTLTILSVLILSTPFVFGQPNPRFGGRRLSASASFGDDSNTAKQAPLAGTTDLFSSLSGPASASAGLGGLGAPRNGGPSPSFSIDPSWSRGLGRSNSRLGRNASFGNNDYSSPPSLGTSLEDVTSNIETKLKSSTLIEDKTLVPNVQSFLTNLSTNNSANMNLDLDGKSINVNAGTIGSPQRLNAIKKLEQLINQEKKDLQWIDTSVAETLGQKLLTPSPSKSFAPSPSRPFLPSPPRSLTPSPSKSRGQFQVTVPASEAANFGNLSQQELMKTLSAYQVKEESEPDLPEYIYKIQNMGDYTRKILNNPKPVLVDIYGTSCKPCKKIYPILKKLIIAKGGAIEMVKINIEETNLGQNLGYTSVPVVLTYWKGKVIDEIKGGYQEPRYVQAVNKLLNAANMNN